MFKPAVSGLDERAASADHELLRAAAGSAQSDDEIAPYRYGPAVSPHLAAELAGERDRARRGCATPRGRAGGGCRRCWSARGSAGFLVPLTPGYLVRDLARDLGFPLVVAAPPGLGTINHTLLTIEAVRAAGLEVGGRRADARGPRSRSEMELSNRETIAALRRRRGADAAAAHRPGRSGELAGAAARSRSEPRFSPPRHSFYRSPPSGR